MAQRQSPEEVNRLLRLAMGERRPIRAIYDNRRRVLCPHRLGWNKKGQRRVLCYQSGGASTRGLDPKGAQSDFFVLVFAPVQDKFHRFILGQTDGTPQALISLFFVPTPIL